MNAITKFGLGLALVGGAANSMLYNGKQNATIKSQYKF